MTVAFVRSMTMVAALVMVRAPFWFAGQPPVQVGLHQRFDRPIGVPGQNVNAMLGKYGERALANAAHYDDLNSLALQPSGKRAGLVFGRRQRLGAEGRLGRGIHFDQSKMAAAAEMRIQTTVFNRNSNLHNLLICPLN